MCSVGVAWRFGRLRKTWAEVTCFDRAFHRHGPARSSVTGGWRTCIRRSELSTKQSEDALSGFTAGRLVQIVGKVSRCFFLYARTASLNSIPTGAFSAQLLSGSAWRLEIDHRLEFGRRKTWQARWRRWRRGRHDDGGSSAVFDQTPANGLPRSRSIR